MPRRSPQLADLHSDIKDEVDEPAIDTRIQKGNRRSITQEAMLIAVSQLKVTLAQLDQRKFPTEMLSTVIDEDTGEIMEYLRLRKNTKYHLLHRT